MNRCDKGDDRICKCDKDHCNARFLLGEETGPQIGDGDKIDGKNDTMKGDKNDSTRLVPYSGAFLSVVVTFLVVGRYYFGTSSSGGGGGADF